MRQKRKVILEYELKKNMLKSSMKSMQPLIASKLKKAKSNTIMPVLYNDLTDGVKQLLETDDITYSLGLFFCLLFGEEYSRICNDEEKLAITLKEMTNEENWDTENISIEVAIYFSYTFFNELYKDIAIDIYLMDQSKNPVEFLKELRSEII